MMHARVFAAVGAAESAAIAGSLACRELIAAPLLPGPGVGFWATGFAVTAAALVLAAVTGRGMRGILLAALGLHAGFAGVLIVYAISESASWVAATFAAFCAAMYAREVLRIGGFLW